MKWRIEETKLKSKTESAFIIIYPDLLIDDLKACCQAMRTPNLTKMYAVVDKRTPLGKTESSLAVLSEVCDGVETVVRFAHPFVISLILYLWRKMKAYCEKAIERKR